MCLIVHRPVTIKGTGKRSRARGSNIPNGTIDYARRHNPDGFGIAWRDSKKGQLIYAKYAPTQFAEFETRLKEVDKDTTQEYVAHWRFATHGPACLRLSHPYSYVDKNLGTVLLFHNGIISPVDTRKEESDTEVFVRDIASKLPSRWWANVAIRALVDEFIGWSRLVIMTPSETVNLHEDRGDWDGGLWYSSAWKDKVYPTAYSGKGWENYRSSSDYHYDPETGDFENEWGEMKDKVWHPSAKSAYLDGDAEDWEGVTVSGTIITPERGKEAFTMEAGGDTDTAWYHYGHVIIPLTQDRSQGFHEQQALCETCHTVGDFYVMEKRVHIDISHVLSGPKPPLPLVGEGK